MTANSQQPELNPFWTHSVDDLLGQLSCSAKGLNSEEAQQRLQQYGLNCDAPPKTESALRAVLRRLLEPLSLILLLAAVVSLITGDTTGGSIIVVILILSIGLDTFQEGQAIKAAAELRHSVALKAEVKRDGRFQSILIGNVVPGDCIRVRAGDIIPADAILLESTAFTTDEAALTGEPYAIEKKPGVVKSLTVAEASNAIFRGSVALTGEAQALVIATGKMTLFGEAALALAEAPIISPFQRDLHNLGLVIARLTLALVLLVLMARVVAGRPLLDSLLFSVALAVGLTPELLPMITTVTLTRGAMRMAKRKVIVKRLASIHDLGAMNVLCTDKTGTLTSASITLAYAIDPNGTKTSRPAKLGAIAAELGGDRGALDKALIDSTPDAARDWQLRDRHAFDYNARRGAILAEGPDGLVLIVKGAPDAIIGLCTAQRDGEGTKPMDAEAHHQAEERVHALSGEGLRAIAIATRPWAKGVYQMDSTAEKELVFEGLCAFADPPKPTAAAAINRLKASGIRLKILSGDDPIVVKRLAGLVGLGTGAVLTGAEVAAMSNEALEYQVQHVDAYGRLTPDQKVRIIRALQARKSIVGFMGDGINDAPGLKAADIGLSVEGASGVAQAAADMILLASDLSVVADGVVEGRRTFANILKYIRMGASSNFGNMLSMAIASPTLSFLPMLPTQILLNNLLYDGSEIGIPLDHVRPESTARPQIFDVRNLVRFAAIMGPLSSIFDILTFLMLLFVFKADPALFRTSWFLESMVTQILVIFIIRTNGRPWDDRPHPALILSSFAALAIAVILPFTPVGAWFGFVVPPLPILASIFVLVLVYLLIAEFLKPFATGIPRPNGKWF
ncbi:magnesium-translocating P-type ATPase [Beijerinckia indica]|uniref:Magnesium-transporting ATPase, P-type 1 n=1 Tax=Beijerinckia indica subsp. indica (strain ATCC 9039 / DSM 1715 / NCIMB 8712) TaxID=395963 RepID=B2IGR1_BEII9|nr:magnesium-translocating P-type ATPase [Beijerinckia indica]ACB95822.1 magnesium-translocating P-type ATPase [Beijerinckia indica subsp. indica ATCC 9039]